MNQTRSLATVAIYFASLGILLSGYLSYQTLFAPIGCSQALITCGGTPVEFFGIPQCVLGFIMFLAAAIVSILILESMRPAPWLSIQLWLSLAGTLFAAGLSVYELWLRQPAPTTMPSCVYGFFLYLGVLIATILARRQEVRA
ncbi:MAG: hypothetical protein HYY50_02655 [Candidatus Kerfeldbacteria bacterium]|nr:hypothetical protein [Candidatus Kerfeldbacteria bacterium]